MTDIVSITCTCGAKLKVDVDKVGSESTCPACGKIVGLGISSEVTERLKKLNHSTVREKEVPLGSDNFLFKSKVKIYKIAYAILGIYTVWSLYEFHSSLKQVEEVIPQAILAIVYCVWMIGPYILVRSIEGCDI